MVHMKIGRDLNTLRGKSISSADNRPSFSLHGKSFNELLDQQDEQHSQTRMAQWIEEINKQGERLSRSMTLRELRQYRMLIKRFLESTAKRGVEIKEFKGWDRRGRGRLYKIIQEVDGKLLEMADELLVREEGRIKILQNIGEIRGLLVNMYF
jgi:uncharacterized protein YaaR (DUF327 family)